MLYFVHLHPKSFYYMRKVIGIGETILDIIFRDNQPEKAIPGGSTFNCIISLRRCNVPASFISELGNDRVGHLLSGFMQENNLTTDYIDFYEEGNSPVSLAFLDENQQAEYQFFRAFSKQRLQINFPEINADDILIISSYFAINPVLREKVFTLIQYAKQQKAIVYYDINFRRAHASERDSLFPSFLENVAHASIVRCSNEDLENFFPGETIESIYRDYIAPRCENLIVTYGKEATKVKTAVFERDYPVESVMPVSTIGAGDNFNAGIIYGLMKNHIFFDDLPYLREKQWDELIVNGHAFSKDSCLSFENFVSLEFAEQMKLLK